MRSLSKATANAACIALVTGSILACDPGKTIAAKPEQFDGKLNDVAWSAQPSAVLITGKGEPDTLVVTGSRHDGLVTARVAFTGRGRYTLKASDVSVVALVGFDGWVGGYTGTPQNAGVLDVKEFEGVGGLLSATLELTADHRDGHATFGSTVAFRDGHIVARLQAATR